MTEPGQDIDEGLKLIRRRHFRMRVVFWSGIPCMFAVAYLLELGGLAEEFSLIAVIFWLAMYATTVLQVILSQCPN